ncbi:MAG TPA: sigma 54-interacting transcriptional regulator [Sandaracinaceae bacterium LLY-WYZ-13_1]|nr:sigma 54-interacting transcriptional regulator [Sandaracinaceae bacterium LLY-WYZ-13_1]
MDDPIGAASPEAWSSVLEQHEDPAILLSPDYRILAANAAYERHYGASIRPGRDHCYRVSHGYDSPCDDNGERCPLRLSRGGRAARVFHIHDGPAGPEHVDVSMTPLESADGRVEAFVEVIRPIPEASAQPEGTFVGRSPAFVRVVELIRRVAPASTPVLLLGESGTGKELAARAIHDASARRDGPFVPVECSGLAESLFESELFGHKKGAFTGATEEKRGLVEAATGGTLFLDEIGDVPLNLQVKLLRVLESGLYRRVGDPVPRRAEFRLVCATHQDLSRMMETGAFRSDLYYRISAFPIDLPPLRERADDVGLLADTLLKAGGSPKRLGREAEALLRRYDFPGNVRELRNLLERAVLLSDGLELAPEHFPEHVRGASAEAPRTGEWPWGDEVIPLREVERRYVHWAADRFDGDRRDLAERLGVSERTLYRRLRSE